MSVIKKWAFIASVLLALPVVISCSDAKLSRAKEGIVSINSEGNFCTQPPDVTTSVTKFMFVIDKSGSNGDTDPNNAKRADNIEKFFNGPAGSPRSANPNVFWGYIEFSGDTAEAYINRNGNRGDPIFVGVPGNVQAMNQALALQRQGDGGTTPYQAALKLTKTAIQNDLRDNPTQSSQYVIFFMSDGLPTDYPPGEGPAGPAAFRDVDDLVNTAPGKVIFSTAYYGPVNPAASNGLKTMSEHGKGKFVDLNNTDDFKLDDLLVGGPRADTYQIKQMVVYNVSSAICLDNEFGADSDGDGLCDRDETSKTKTDPQNRFSYGDGYSDYFHYIASLSQSTLPPCIDRSDLDNDLLTFCEENYMYNSRPTGTKKTAADPLNPDTEYDGIIDGIEYFMLHNKSAPLDNLNLFKSFDGETVNAGEQILQHRNPLYPDINLPKEAVYDTKWEFTGYNSLGQSCYRFTQKNLRTYKTMALDSSKALNPMLSHPANGNVVLVYFIQTLEKDPNGPGVYMFSYQTLLGGVPNAPGLQIFDRIFRPYKIPEEGVVP